MSSRNTGAKLTPADLEHLLIMGYNQTRIAEMYEVSRQYVSEIRRKYGIPLPARTVLLEQHFPWRVPEALTQASPYRRLRDHGEYVGTNGVGMSADKLRRLRTFYRQMRDQVVVFDPALPPEPGVAKCGGWAYCKRNAADGDLLVRVVEPMTDEARRVWSFPPIEP
ncbi:XRE family transcriptional regulator [Mycobacterium sp. URHB0021]